MAQLVIGVIRDVLRHIFVENVQSFLIGIITQRKLSVLLPQIGLDKLGCGKKAKDRGIAVVDGTVIGGRARGCAEKTGRGDESVAPRPRLRRNDRRAMGFGEGRSCAKSDNSVSLGSGLLLASVCMVFAWLRI